MKVFRGLWVKNTLHLCLIDDDVLFAGTISDPTFETTVYENSALRSTDEMRYIRATYYIIIINNNN